MCELTSYFSDWNRKIFNFSNVNEELDGCIIWSYHLHAALKQQTIGKCSSLINQWLIDKTTRLPALFLIWVFPLFQFISTFFACPLDIRTDRFGQGDFEETESG